MRARRTSLAAIVLPVLGYLTLLALVAALYVHPPLLGWIGFAVVGALGSVVATGAAVLFPRMRANVEPADLAPRDRLLVLADGRPSDDRVCDAVAAHLAGRRAEVLVVAPVLASPLHYLTGEERVEHAAAQTRLDALVTGLRRRGLRAEGRLGDDDPLQSLGDALAAFPAREALIVTSAGGHWLEPGLVARARTLVDSVELVHSA